jgi:predicted O-methyltransferase YrrM
MRPPYAKKKRNLNSIVREAWGEARYRDDEVEDFFDLDWSKIEGDRKTVVRALIQATGARSYLEIGCAENLLFDTVQADRKVGVDPAQGGTHRMTSDAFFAANGETFEVVFIDGLHVYNQVRRDVANALKVVPAGGWIALHDMFPRDWIEEHTPQISTSRWTGDPWKVGFELIRTTGVEFRLLSIDHGVGVIRVLNDGAVLADRRVELTDKRFAWFRENFAELPVIDWRAAEAWFGGDR